MMHKRVFASFAIAAAMLAAAPAFAEVKLASVRYEELVNNSPQRKAASDKFKGEFQKREEDFTAEAKQFQDDAAKFQHDADTMAPDQKNRKAQDLQSRQADLQRDQQKLAEDEQSRKLELMQVVESRIRDVIFQIAKERGYDMVVGDAVYAAQSIDITDEVLKRLTAAAPAAAPTIQVNPKPPLWPPVQTAV